MRGGEIKDVLIKYEKLPFFCYVCGLLGDGDQDCNEHREEESPKKKFGGWLRASPWRVKAPDLKEKVEDKKGGCTKKLFIAKPQRQKSGNEKEQEDEVIQKSGAFVLESIGKATEERNNQEDNVGDGGGIIASLSEKSNEPVQVLDKTKEGNNKEPEGNPSEEGRKWKRVKNRRAHVPSKTELTFVGSKRNSKDVEIWRSQEMDIDHVVALKKRGVIVDTTKTADSTKRDNVAGSTKRALFDQC